MVTEGLLKIGGGLLDIIYMCFGVLPTVSDNITGAVDMVFDIMFNSVNLVGIFLDLNMVKILIPLAIGVIHFDDIVKLTMFVIKKIPLIDLK